MDNAWVSVARLASVTRTVNEEVPAAVGVPEIVPAIASRVRPAGRAPEAMVNKKGFFPPVTTKEAL
jgi:hypothetical protein